MQEYYNDGNITLKNDYSRLVTFVLYIHTLTFKSKFLNEWLCKRILLEVSTPHYQHQIRVVGCKRKYCRKRRVIHRLDFSGVKTNLLFLIYW